MLGIGAIWGLIVLIWPMYKQFIPHQITSYLAKKANKMIGWIFPYVHIKFPEYIEEGLKRSERYDAIRNYLSTISAADVKRLKANESKNSESLVLSMDDHEEVEDTFNGVKVNWSSNVKEIQTQTQSDSGRSTTDEQRSFTLSFHGDHRNAIINTYVDHVLKEGKAIGLRNRERKLYTNNSSQEWQPWRAARRWSSIPFHHPATFDTLAMDRDKKERIIKDLEMFSKREDYYRQVGKPWKRGYLLYGPPGTGKSTMISAIANLLEYDVYDLELTTVKDNSELKKLLLDTTSKSLIVIEDIDCSLDLTGHRKNKKEEDEEEEGDEKKSKGDGRQSKVTLSGLLNSIDGLWSACSGEKIIVFTTNFVDKLDPALIRRGRMDYHIEMSYCRFEAFKVLARNYLEIESHDFYEDIERLLEEINMSPADVAEILMPKSDEEVADICIERLVKTLEEEKEKVRKLAEEEEEKEAEKKTKAEEAEKRKTEEEENKRAEEAEKKKTEEEEKKKAKRGRTVTFLQKMVSAKKK
ncbi:AAA-ATPase [Cardamine amara subsp. amara]|uniref:AAA-ATPase n=1 Tax=Cardamine amara subsp. amara TaxID=228776 RepID=A0ABD1C205_CARAN